MNRIQRDTLLGVVFFGTMAFLLWATVNLTDLSMGGIPPLKVFVADAGGIRVGDPVQVLGKKVGKVGAIDMAWDRRENRVALTLRVEERIPLALDQRIEIQNAGVLGGKQVYIDPGSGAAWPVDRELIGKAASDPLKAAGEFFDGQGPSGSELKGLLIEARTFMKSLNDPYTSIGALVKGRELYDEVLGSAQSLRNIFQSIERGDGLLGRVIKDSKLREDALRIVQNLAAVSERLNTTEGAIGLLLNDRELSQNLASTVANLARIVSDVRDGRGAAGALLRDEALAGELRAAMTSLASALRKADDPAAGALGALLGDQELRTQVKDIAGGLASITGKIDTGKGTLGVLINDEEMGQRLRRIFVQVSRALEDAREAAPIANFVQVLFGVF